MPYKHSDLRRHKFERAGYRVTNWRAYNDALRQRGSLTFWLTDEALEHWCAPRRTTPGGQPLYSDMAIEICLTLRSLFSLPLRQAEGFMRSIRALLKLDIPIPHYTTYSRRGNGLPIPARFKRRGSEPVVLVADSTGLKIFGEGEWLQKKHKTGGKRRTWRKLHICIDLTDNEIVAMELTTEAVGDTTALPDLLNQINGDIERFLADGAYDGGPTYQLMADRPQGSIIQTVIPPPKNAILSAQAETHQTERDRHIQDIESKGRMAWQKDTGYNLRSRVEAQIGRWKNVIGNKLRSRTLLNQITEAKIGQKILNRMNGLGRPMFERIV